MDDFGNFYQDDTWFLTADQYSSSMATFGFADDEMMDLCFTYSIDYAAQEI